MKLTSIFKKDQSFQQLKCFAVFFLIVAPVVYCTIEFAAFLGYTLPFFLFFLGWFIWTFVEYILHRFWNHAKGVENNSIVHRHHHHHTHPTDIYVSATHRSMMLLIDLALISLSIWLNPHIMFIAGLWTGFFWFFLMHYFLHQKWTKKVFPRLVRYHVVHHCKEPDTCFGISAAWWDGIFGTTPKKNKEISERILAFYYKKEKQGCSISSLIDEKLSDTQRHKH
ncbi:MAG: sterol desaturase family protein [Chitinophagales bacterium]